MTPEPSAPGAAPAVSRRDAGAVVYLASPAARFVTGHVLDVAAGANARYTA